ncbi:uncharacterized protein VTP21DRAFT_9491 [Calcarisporiella thermophila]|uniref:uncharacterized protein n=1 Tax=Calcarisporiella thermophila TaxID=911321 RepID=UPI0037442847
MVIKSPYPPVVIPDVDLFTFLFSQKDSIPQHKDVFVDAVTGNALTYGQLESDAKRFSAMLQERYAFQPGSVVAIYAPNHLDYAVPLYGVWAAGGVVSPVNSYYTVDELTHQLELSGARYLVTHPDVLDVALGATRRANIPNHHLLLYGDTEVKGIRPYRALMTEQERNPVKVNPNEIALLNFSSGTTGKSKGVMLTHRNLVSNMMQIKIYDKGHIDSDRDVQAAAVPLYHMYGLLLIILFALHHGRKSVILPRFDLELFLASIQKYRVTYAPLVPPIILLLAKHPLVDKYDVSSLRKIFSAAAPLSDELGQELKQRLGIVLRQGYGMTELSPFTHMAPWDMEDEYGTVGPLVSNMEAKVVDTNGKEVKAGEIGELWVRGPNVMKGYIKNIEATRETIDPDGFLHTGDICRYDERGYFYIVDRAKELIKYKGFQVAPAELEALLLTHPKVADCCVIGIYSSDNMTELPCAFVVPKQNIADDKRTLSQELVDFVKARVAHYKQLRGGVHFVESIPKSAAGKILRRVLRSQLPSQSDIKLISKL